MGSTTSAPISRKETRRVVAATTIGTAIEWYDYFLYAAVAGLVFNQVMFGPPRRRGSQHRLLRLRGPVLPVSPAWRVPSGPFW